MHYIEESLLEGIRLNDADTLEYIYKKFYPTVRTFITINNGNEEDAKDIFQESIIVIYRKLRDNNFTLTCSLKTYIYSVGKNLWLKELERRKIENDNIKDTEELTGTNEVEVEIPLMNPHNEKFKLYQEHFLSLSKDCQKVLRLFMEKVPLKEIARIMGYSSEKYAKKRKFQCKEILVKKIKSDPNFLNPNT